jgi:hypothetical protein
VTVHETEINKSESTNVGLQLPEKTWHHAETRNNDAE